MPRIGDNFVFVLLNQCSEIGLELNSDNTKFIFSLEINMEDEVKITTLVINPLKRWKSSYVWEQHYRMKILFRKKLRAG